MATVLLLEDVTVTRAMMMMIVKNVSEDCINTIRSETKAKQIQKQNKNRREQGFKVQNENR